MRRTRIQNCLCIAVTVVVIGGCCSEDTTHRDQALRSFVIGSGALMRAGHYDQATVRIETYLGAACKPATRADSVRTAYLYAHLARSYFFLGEFRGATGAFERGRYLLGLLSDSLQIELLQGVATSYIEAGDLVEAERLALKSALMSFRRGDALNEAESLQCYYRIAERRQNGEVNLNWLVLLLVGFFELIIFYYFGPPLRRWLARFLPGSYRDPGLCLDAWPSRAESPSGAVPSEANGDPGSSSRNNGRET